MILPAVPCQDLQENWVLWTPERYAMTLLSVMGICSYI